MNTIKSINDSGCDTRMVPRQIECVVCRGRCVVTRYLPMRPGGIEHEMQIGCPNCEGSGETTIEVCNNCQQSEEECPCLEVEQGRKEAA